MPRRSRNATQELEELAGSPRSTDSVAVPTVVETATLVQALRELGLSNNSKEMFRAPTYSGEGDVELFIKQFNDVASANGWSEGQQTLHLRTQLQGAAQGCGRGACKAEIIEDLRARFGVTCRQAKDRLSGLKRGARQSLHELCTEVARMVELGFPTLPRVDQDSLVLDYFLRAVDNRALQRHMLAIRPRTPMEAVKAAEEFFTACGPEKAYARAMPVELDLGKVELGATHQLQRDFEGLANMMREQTALLTKLVGSLEDRRPARRNGGSGSVACFECGGPHLKRNCPRVGTRQGNGMAAGRGTNQSNQGPRQGNGQGPAQE